MKSKKFRINFILPGFGIQPIGGFKIAYLYANYLAREGFDVQIIHAYTVETKICKSEYLVDKCTMFLKKNTWMNFHANVKCHYVAQLNENTIPNAAVTVATAWSTARILNGMGKNKGKKVYLIQHYETWNASKKEVDATWKYDMHKVVISQWLYKVGMQMGCTNITYIPNSLNFKKYQVFKPIEFRKKVICMLYNRNLSWKGSKEGIIVFKKLREKYSDLRVIFFGTENRTSDIPQWIEYYENPKQNFLVNDIYNASSIFLCSSWFEGWGLPSMEAMACGCATVTTANGGVEDFCIERKTALLCPVHDIDAMVNAIIELLENDEYRIRLAQEGNKYIRRFRWKDSFHKFEQVIKNEIAKR